MFRPSSAAVDSDGRGRTRRKYPTSPDRAHAVYIGVEFRSDGEAVKVARVQLLDNLVFGVNARHICFRVGHRFSHCTISEIPDLVRPSYLSKSR